jgi:hypothetical protein
MTTRIEARTFVLVCGAWHGGRCWSLRNIARNRRATRLFALRDPGALDSDTLGARLRDKAAEFEPLGQDLL